VSDDAAHASLGRKFVSKGKNFGNHSHDLGVAIIFRNFAKSELGCAQNRVRVTPLRPTAAARNSFNRAL
jgi:hypothetical protein